MKTFIAVLLLIAYAFCAGAKLRVLPSTTCQDEMVELKVKPVRANVDNLVEFNTRAYFWKGTPMIPGPTLLMAPGKQCRLRITNELDTTSEAATCSHEANGFHCVDTTNVHVHGLHVHPSVDDMGVHIIPGHHHDYDYTIPEDHMAGTHWYHSHYHGTTTLHTHGGLAGAIDMLPAEDAEIPDDLRKLYKDSVLMMLLHINFGGEVNYGFDAWNLWDYPTVSSFYQPQTINPDPKISSDLVSFYTANTQYQPYVEMEADKVQMLRIIHATGTYIVELEQEPKGACEMQIIARDGVFQYTPYLKVDSIVMPQGGRADVAFKCKPAYAGQEIKIGSYADPKRDLTLGKRVRFNQKHIFTIKVKENKSGPTSFPTASLPFPAYLQDLMKAPRVSLPQKNTVDVEFTININHIPFPGHHAAGRWLDTLCLGKTYEFNMFPGSSPTNHIAAGGAVHPYHQHIIHFQVSDAGTDGTDGEIMRVGEWRDVVPVPLPNGFSYRLRPLRWTGDYMFHCHLTWHEDFGMMLFYDVTDCDPTAPEKQLVEEGGHGDGGHH